MFDDNNIDKMMKSILENGREDVPAHIWENVSASLDKVAKQKAVVIWRKRIAIGTAAAAAIIAGILFNHKADTIPAQHSHSQLSQLSKPQPEQLSKPNADVIEVIPTEATPEDLLCYTPTTAQSPTKAREINIEQALERIEEQRDVRPKTAEHETVEDVLSKIDIKGVDAEDYIWEEDIEDVRKPIKTSLVLSGITSTNNAQINGRANIMKRPSLVAKPIQTGVTENGANTIYGIPVSAGVGVKIDFNEKWSLGTGINYTFLTSRFDGTYTRAENGIEVNSIKSEIRNTQHFIGIPINVYYKIIGNRNLNFYAYIGGAVERCVSNKYNILNSNLVHKDSPAGVQLSANAGAGVEFLLGQHLGLYIDPSLRYYFDNDQPKSIRTSQPLTLGLEVGLRINL